MSVEIPDPVSIKTQPTFWELFLASLVAIPYQGRLIFFHAVSPLVGLFLLLTPLLGYRLGPEEIIVAILAFSFTPLTTVLGIWSRRRRNKLAQGALTYTFDAEGMHTSGSAFEQTIRWSGIHRIRLSKRFLFVFISPSRAHCIPLRSLSAPDDLDRIREIAFGRTDFR